MLESFHLRFNQTLTPSISRTKKLVPNIFRAFFEMPQKTLITQKSLATAWKARKVWTFFDFLSKSFIRRGLRQDFFINHFANQRLNLGQRRGDSFTYVMLIIAFYCFDKSIIGSIAMSLDPITM